MIELNEFYNDGFGWICRQCERELAPAPNKTSRLLREGEGESELSSHALAKWADPAQTTLFCPRCGITETVEKS